MKSESICQHCVYEAAGVLMLTTYSLKNLRCDRCDRIADLAMVSNECDE